MKIKDLKEPYRSMALYEQENQGNEKNPELNLTQTRIEGNFEWEDSLFGMICWNKTDDGNYPKITPEIKEKFPPEIFKTKLEVGKKYRLRYWDSHEWVEVLYFGKKYFFSVDDEGNEDHWLINRHWLPYEENPKKELENYEKFYVLDCGILRVVYAENLDKVLANCASLDKVYTEEEVIEKGLKI